MDDFLRVLQEEHLFLLLVAEIHRASMQKKCWRVVKRYEGSSVSCLMSKSEGKRMFVVCLPLPVFAC